MGSATSVHEKEVGIIEQFGKFKKVAQPGCVWKCWLAGERVSGRLSMKIQQLDVPCETKTSDNVFVTVVVSVQFRVVEPFDAYYKLSNSRSQITSYVFDVIRAAVPKLSLDAVFLAKENLASTLKTDLASAMVTFGYEIMNTLITDISPDSQVKHAMNDINASERLRIAAAAYAEAEKVRIVKNAEADVEVKRLEADAIAKERGAIMDSLSSNIVSMTANIPGMQSRDAVQMMMTAQYYEMLREVGNRGKPVYVSSKTDHLNQARCVRNL